MTRDEIIAISNAAADVAGIPRVLLLACGVAESNLRPNARRPPSPAGDQNYWPDVSGGVWQQTVRYDPDYRGGNGYPGSEEIERILHLQYDPVRSAIVAAENLRGKYRPGEDDGIFKALNRYNWPGGNGRPYTDAHAQNYRRGIAEAERLLGATPMPATLTYNPDAPVDLQFDDFSCSEQSAQWLLRSIGRTPGDAWIRGQFLDNGIMTREHGLMDASGAQLAAWLQREYGDEMGLRFASKNGASWDEIAALAGKQPLMIGGRSWNHWSGVRRAKDGGLELANSAPNWKDTGTLLDRDEFDRFGSWSYITVSAPGAAPTPTDSKDRRIAELEAEIARLNAVLAEERTKLGVASTDYVRGLRDLANAYEALKPTP